MTPSGGRRKSLSLVGAFVLVLAIIGTSAFQAVVAFADSSIAPGSLQVTQITGGPAVANQPLSFTISVTNTTTGVASGVLLGDTPPTGMGITALLGPGGNPDLCARSKTGSFSCIMGDLGPGATATLSFTGTPSVVGLQTNSAVAQGCVGLQTVPPAGVTCSSAGGLFVTTTAPQQLNVLATAPSPTPATAPLAPTAVNALAGNAQASVSWVPPLNNGGSAITSYTVTSSPAGATATIAAPVTVATLTGLTNGTAYTFTVTATNAIGTSPASVASNSVTPVAPATAPGAPTGVTATGGNAQANVTWVAPLSNGGSAITSYTVTSSPAGATATVAAPATSATLSGLTNGTAYTFTVTATNAIGTSPASAASNSVTPAAPVTAPGAPTGVTATRGNAQANVAWVAPLSNGGSAITSYTVTSTPAGGSDTVTAPATSAVVSGLTNGTAYTFTVVATNAVGSGAASAASNSVTPVAPATVPAAPSAVSAIAGNASATITWTASVSDGGSAITGYTVTSSPAGASTTATAPATSTTITGLTNGTPYTFTVTANNAVGPSVASAPSNSVTPIGALPTKLQFYPLASPVRLLDTRSSSTVGCDLGVGALPAGNTRTEPATGACTGIPANAKAVFGNVTAVAPPSAGYVTLFPSSVASPPTVSNVNYPALAIVNNAFTVGLGADGAFKIFTGSQTDLVVDITGYFADPASGGLYFHPLPSPVRLLDTRSSSTVGCDLGVGALPAGNTRTEPATGACTGIPANAKAVFGNVTAVAPPSAGYVTLFPSSVANPPTVSNVNYPALAIVNNAFTVGLGADGAFKIFTGSQTELVVDITGYYDTNAAGGQLFAPLRSPVRLLDTRSSSTVGCDLGAGVLPAGGTRVEPAVDACTGIPTGATAVFGNATVVAPSNPGYVTLFPSSVPVAPTVSNLNYPAFGIINTAFTVGLGPDGAFKILTGSATQLVIDLTGAYVPGP